MPCRFWEESSFAKVGKCHLNHLLYGYNTKHLRKGPSTHSCKDKFKKEKKNPGKSCSSLEPEILLSVWSNKTGTMGRLQWAFFTTVIMDIIYPWGGHHRRHTHCFWHLIQQTSTAFFFFASLTDFIRKLTSNQVHPLPSLLQKWVSGNTHSGMQSWIRVCCSVPAFRHR